jgi:predicted phosphodiesterase
VRIAALYDIHGNLPALEAVLSELGRIDLVLVGGDVVCGPWPQEAMQALRSLRNVEFIMGNADRDVFELPMAGGSRPSIGARTGSPTRIWLSCAPVRRRLRQTAPCSVTAHRGATPTRSRWGHRQERIAAWSAGVKETTVVSGHTHSQFERQMGPWHIVNPGSLGNPFGDLGAYWAILDPDLEFRFTPYDVQTTAEKILATGFPYGDRMAARIASRATAEDAAQFFETPSG